MVRLFLITKVSGRKKNGEMIEMSILPSPIKNHQGQMTGISFIARDVTEKKKLEKEVIEIGEKERERIGRDLHDSLGQQLTGILLNMKSVENTLREKCSEEEVEQIINTKEMIKTAIQQTRTMAKNMIPVKLETEGLPHALEDLANFARTVYKLNVETKIDNEITGINKITETQIYHIAQEAINNAVKHSGGDKLSITLNILQSELVLSVNDNGKGIPKQDLPYIFDKFYRVHTGDLHDVKGFGLGLSYVKKIVDAHEGTIDVWSEPGKGTAFTIRIPTIKK
jgi:signal transduction histidine kinase